MRTHCTNERQIPIGHAEYDRLLLPQLGYTRNYMSAEDLSIISVSSFAQRIMLHVHPGRKVASGRLDFNFTCHSILLSLGADGVTLYNITIQCPLTADIPAMLRYHCGDHRTCR